MSRACLVESKPSPWRQREGPWVELIVECVVVVVVGGNASKIEPALVSCSFADL